MMLKLQGQQPSRQGRPFLAGFISLTLTLSLCPTAFAQTTPTLRETQIGTSCTKYAHSTDFDALAQCNNTTGGTMQKAPLFIGAVTSPPYTTTTCDANKAGMIQYVGVLMQYCNGTSWTTIASGSLGASAAATNPSRSGDVTTGLFSSTASTVSIATAGTERLRVTPTGNVGIGTTSPAAPLDISSISVLASATYGGGTDYLHLSAAAGSAFSEPAIVFQEAGTNAGAKIAVKNRQNGAYDIIFANRDNSSLTSTMAERMRIMAGGNVGIGTTTPATLLHVDGDTPILTLQNTNGNAGGGGVVRFGHNQSSSTLPVAQIRSYLTNGGGAGLRSGDLLFSTSTLGVLTDWMTISSAGKVGIGTTSPKQKLDVAGDVNIGTGTNTFPSTPAGSWGAINFNGGSFLRMVMNDGSGNFAEYLNSYFDGATGSHMYQQAAPANRFVTSGGTYAFYVAPTGTAGNAITWTTALGIDNSGNVGVGTTAPSAKLEIVDAGASSLRVGTTDNRTNAYAQVKNSLHVWSTAATAYSEIGAVDLNFYNAGSSPSFSGMMSRFYGASATGTISGITNAPAAASAGELIGQNVSSVSLGSNGTTPIYFYNGAMGTMMTISSAGKVGIGTTAPAAPFEIYKTAAAPATSGTTTTALMRLHPTNTNSILDVGVSPTSPYAGWLQQTDLTNLGLGYPLALNPNGGNVGIGTMTPNSLFTVYKNVPATVSVANASLYLRGADNGYGVAMGTLAGGYAWMQGMLNDAASIGLLLNPSGGNVGIGTTAPVTKLEVASGEVKVGSSGTACSTTNAGAIRWSGSAFQGCNGSSWTSLGSSGVSTWPARAITLAAGTTYTPPSDVKSIRVFVWGATGGNRAYNVVSGGSGGAGYSEKYYATISASYAYSIGAGGASGGDSTSATAGGTTTFDTMTVTGGAAVNNSSTGSAGGSGSGGDFNATGGTGGNGSYYGGGGGGAASRAGNGGTGGAGTGAGMGPGGGTGGNNATTTVAGIAATSVAATTILGFDTDINRVYFLPGSLGASVASCLDGNGDTVYTYQGGNGADGTESFNGGSFYIQGKDTGGLGGMNKLCTSNYRAGRKGVITIWEYI